MLDKNDQINILSPTFSQNPVFKITYSILFIAPEYINILFLKMNTLYSTLQ